MRKRIFLRIFLISAVVILLVGGVMSGLFAYTKEQDIISGMEDSLHIMLGSCDIQMEDKEALADQMKELSGNRITIVGPDGTVLGDSDEDAAALPNHGDREEIKEARTTSIGISKRQSDTFLTSMVYVAIKSGDNIYRMAQTTREITDVLMGVWPIAIVAVAIALVVALLLSGYAADRAMKPLTDTVEAVKSQWDSPDGSERPVDAAALEEISPLIQTIGEMSEDITRTRDKLTTQRDQTRFILDNMEQGIIFIDSNRKVLLVNSSARNFLGEQGEAEGLDLIHLTRDMKLYDSISLAVSEGRSLSLIHI